MPSESLVITELTGSRRSIRLSDRALPYQGLSAPTRQRVVQRWYPGSRVATLQLLGPEVGDWELKGMWKTRFLSAAPMVQLDGWPNVDNTGGLVAAEDLVQVFHELCEAANTLQVQWGPETRIGVLEDFDPDYDRTEDIRWRMAFKWSQRGKAAAARASAPSDPVAEVRRALDALDFTVAEMPASVLPTESKSVLDRVDAVRAAGTALTEKLASIQLAATSTVADVQSVRVLAGRTVAAAQALRAGNLSDLPYVQLLPLDALSEVFSVEVWRRDLGASSRDVQAASAQSAATAAQQGSPGAQRVVTARQGETLRRIALRELGDADAWTQIADDNNIVGSDVAPGTRLVIRRPPAQVSTTR